MDKAAKTTRTMPSKAQASEKTKTGEASKKQASSGTRARATKREPSKTRAASQSRTTQKTRGPSRRRANSEASSQSWGSLLTTLVTSPLGRAIMADVLIAAADALRKDRPNLQQTVEEGTQQVMKVGGAAIDAGSDVASAAVTLAQSAAGALAEVVTDAARDMLPGSTAEGSKGRSAKRGRQRRT